MSAEPYGEHLRPASTRPEARTDPGYHLPRFGRATGGVVALVSLTREIGVALVTEGVERVSTARALVELGVECGQGFWLSPPLGAEPLPGLAGIPIGG